MAARTTSRSGRLGLAAVLAVATLIGAAYLGVQAELEARRHRSTTKVVLSGYTALAAAVYRSRAFQQLGYNTFYPLSTVLASWPDDVPLPDPSSPPDGMSANATRALSTVSGVFRSSELGVDFVGRSQPAGFESWIEGHRTRWTPTSSGYRLFPPSAATDGSYSVMSVDEGRTRGFLMTPESVGHLFEAAYHAEPLLPSMLTGGEGLPELFRVEVRAPDGTLLMDMLPPSIEPAESWLSHTDTLSAELGELRVVTHLDARVADRFLDTGVNKTRRLAILPVVALLGFLLVGSLGLMRREAELARLRGDFVSGISHEFRTPLAQIRLFAETLRLGRVRDQQEHDRSIQIIDQEARRLTHLVETALNFSRAERGALELHLSEANIEHVVDEVVEAFAPLAHAAGVTVRAEGKIPFSLKVDVDALKQLLLNLLDNAVKYGPPGQQVKLVMASNDTIATVAVEDEGPGVPSRDRGRIFDRFVRLDRERNGQVAGTGIGLSVVREIAQLHGGRVRVESRSPLGARFVLELPLAVV